MGSIHRLNESGLRDVQLVQRRVELQIIDNQPEEALGPKTSRHHRRPHRTQEIRVER